MDLDKFSLAVPGRLISPSLNLTKNATIDSIARIQFYATIAKSEDHVAKSVWYDAIDCEEYFKDILDNPKYPSFRREFPKGERWICPNVDKYQLLNNPFLFWGKNFAMVIN